MDCNVTFAGDDYVAHTSCISEAQKYEGALYMGGKKGKVPKRNPQEMWMDLVAEAAKDPSTPPKMREQLAHMAELGNVPKQQKKFFNFVKNSLKLRNDAEIQAIWGHLEKLRAAQREAAAAAKADDAAAAGTANESSTAETPEDAGTEAPVEATIATEVAADTPSSTKKSKKRKHAESAAADTEAAPTEASTATHGSNSASNDSAQAIADSISAPNFAKAAKKVLKGAGPEGLSVKQLRRSVLETFSESSSTDADAKLLKKQFNAALDAGLKHIEVTDKQARLKQKS